MSGSPGMADDHVSVVAAVIERDGLYLLTERMPGTHLAGMWEFPGGKREPGETPEEALAREIREELDLGDIRRRAGDAHPAPLPREGGRTRFLPRPDRLGRARGHRLRGDPLGEAGGPFLPPDARGGPAPSSRSSRAGDRRHTQIPPRYRSIRSPGAEPGYLAARRQLCDIRTFVFASNTGPARRGYAFRADTRPRRRQDTLRMGRESR